MESTHFQEEMMARGLAIEHLEVDPVPEVADTCLGFTVVAILRGQVNDLWHYPIHLVLDLPHPDLHLHHLTQA